MLVASLRDDPTPDATTEATLTRMITESDNGAAYTIFGQVGAEGMRAVARDAGMQDYEQGSGWIDTRASAWDEAHFFSRLESLVPAAGRSLARRLLSSVIPIQRWGIPAAAGPAGWTSYFKGGWLGMDNKLMVQAAWLEKGKQRWALAVMSDEQPHAVLRLGHAEGRHGAAAGPGADAVLPGGRAGMIGVVESSTGAPRGTRHDPSTAGQLSG